MNRILAAVIISLGIPAVAAAQAPDWTLKLQLGKPVFVGGVSARLSFNW